MSKLLKIVVLFLTPMYLLGQENCRISDIPFQLREKINYTVYYNWGFIWVSAGEVSFSIADTIYENQAVFHFLGMGKTFKKYDWFYKVRDRYEVFSNKETLKPIHFIREVNEGSFHLHNEYRFDFGKNQLFSDVIDSKKSRELDTIKITDCTFDAISMIYVARCIDFSQYRVDDKIPITIVLDNKVHDIYIRYLGEERLEIKDKGVYNTLKFAPLLVEGSIFKGGEDMTVWVSNDDNRIPLQIKSEILVGSVNVIFDSLQGLKYPIDY